jgi:hypothetical protein
MDNLTNFLKNEQTHAGVGKAIVKILNSWHDHVNIKVSTLPGGHNVMASGSAQISAVNWASEDG